VRSSTRSAGVRRSMNVATPTSTPLVLALVAPHGAPQRKMRAGGRRSTPSVEEVNADDRSRRLGAAMGGAGGSDALGGGGGGGGVERAKRCRWRLHRRAVCGGGGGWIGYGWFRDHRRAPAVPGGWSAAPAKRPWP